MITTGAPAALELSRVRKSYGNVVAVDDASLSVRAGTVHALLGENGAGKSTLMRVAYGLVSPDSGEIRVRGELRRFESPLDALEAGIGMVHQHFTLVPTFTVGENLALGGTGRLHRDEMSARVADVASRTGFRLDANVRVETLSIGARQRVEIAKALARNPSLLILDEPTAVLAPSEVRELLGWLRRFVDDGHAAIIITHKLHEALAVADHVTVMRRGRVVTEGATSSFSATDLTRAMLGEATGEQSAQHAAFSSDIGAPVFEARGISVADDTARIRVRDASFTIFSGECVGVAAIEGAGQHDLLRALAGRAQVTAGVLSRPDSVGYVPEDRHRDAVMLTRDIVENIALRGAGERHGRMSWSDWRSRAEALTHVGDVRADSVTMPVSTLSGGNQQKLVLARELEASDAGPIRALVADNPTRGLDVRATAAVHERLREAARAGAAVVVYSSDLDEILAIATRVLVLHDGAVREVALDRDLIGRAMIGTP